MELLNNFLYMIIGWVLRIGILFFLYLYSNVHWIKKPKIKLTKMLILTFLRRKDKKSYPIQLNSSQRAIVPKLTSRAINYVVD